MQEKIKYTWDLTKLIPDENQKDIENENQKVISASYKFINKWKSRKDFLENPKVLEEALENFGEWLKYYAGGGNIGYYYELRNALNQNDPEIKANLAKINEQAVKIGNDIQFFEYKLSKVPLKQQKIFLQAEDLKKYRHFLEGLFKTAKYLLSEKEEKILNLTHETSYSNWVRMTSSILSKEEATVLTENGDKQKKNLSEIISVLNSQNKKVRDSAAEAFNNILKNNLDIAENEINSILQSKKTIDELKKIKRPDLPRHLSDDIETEVVDSLIKSVSERFDISQRYYELKAKLMNVKKLEYHERNVEYGKLSENYEYDKSVELIYKVLNKLDPQFSEIFSDLIKKGHVDAYPKQGKTPGAFCAGGLISQPNYILLNHTNRLVDTLTLAHETGHAINNFLSKKAQDPINYDISLATAEVASTFIEDFVFEEISKNAGPEEKLAILMHKLNEDISTIFRQAACYKFEWDMHRKFRAKGYLSKDEIGKLFQKNMSAYMGSSVEKSKGSENWWVYWSHIRSFFYVYSYASGLIISKNLQKMIKDNPKNITKIKTLLSAGDSESPYQIFKRVGIDISDKKFWSSGLQEVERLLAKANNTATSLRLII